MLKFVKKENNPRFQNWYKKDIQNVSMKKKTTTITT